MKPVPIKYIIPGLIFILFNSCEKEVKQVKLPPFEQKLVIASFLSPSDSLSSITVSSNMRLYGELNDYEAPGNLSGSISDGSKTVELEPSVTGLIFKKDQIKIDPGKTYHLKVMSDKGMTAEGECTVPPDHDFIIHADTFSVLHKVHEYSVWREFNIDISFRDVPGESNYYRITGTFIGYTTYSDPVRTEKTIQQLYFSKNLFADNETDQSGLIRTTTGFTNTTSYYDSALVKIYLLNTERSYYLYHKSLQDYNSGEDPFSEVTPVYSNITGGLGIFTSYTSDSLTYRLK